MACEKMKGAGAKRALILPVGGGFHSPCMAPAQVELSKQSMQLLLIFLFAPFTKMYMHCL